MAAGDITPGRRVYAMADIERPGDYFGPTTDYTAEVPSIFFLKPNARDEDAPPRARSVQHVCIPPHSYTENEDGTLTISPSIGETMRGGTGESDGWHGYLENGKWRQV